MNVAQELLWEGQPAEVRRVAEEYIASRVEAATDRVFQDGMRHGWQDGYNRGFDEGIAEGHRRAAALKEKLA